MQIYHGQGVFGGIVIGKIKLYKKSLPIVKEAEIEDVEAEILRFHEAKNKAIEQLQALYEKTLQECGEEQAAIFEVHQMLLKEEQYREVIETIIRVQKLNVECAVMAAGQALSKVFAKMDTEYMQARVADIRDVSERVLSALNEGEDAFRLDEPSIIVSEDLTPSQTMQFRQKMVLSFVTSGGSVNSHTAILARSMSIPSVVGTDMMITDEIEGKLAIVDGFDGTIYIEPDAQTIVQLQKKQVDVQEEEIQLQKLQGEASITLDGKRVRICANIGRLEDVKMALQNGAEGIGLFRSEFIYLDRDSFPTEEEQFQIYKTVLETMNGKRVVIRTLDIGADKPCDYFKMEKETNPALGYRGIRVSLSRPEIFKTQLRALFRASTYGWLAIMYPMITSVKEVREIYEIVQEVKEELTSQGIPYGNVTQGIMIETPAAVMLSEELAREVDFFSIGTNDLTQYTLALDRQNPRLNAFYDPHHSAVLRMIEMVAKNAYKTGTYVSICGELAANTALTKDFLRMAIDELSVSPGMILPLREVVRKSRIE